MYKPLPLFIGLRYTRAKRHNHFISFISLISMLGIALGVTVLITVLSVMNGFDHEISHQVFAFAPHATVTKYGGIHDWQNISSQLQQHKEVVATAPLVTGQAMINGRGRSTGARIISVSPQAETQVSNIADNITAGSWQALKPGSFGIVLGQQLANQLGVRVGDKVLVVVPLTTATPVGVLPRMKRFTVVGEFKAGAGFGFDKETAFIQLEDGKLLFKSQGKVSGIRLKLKDVYRAPQVTYELNQKLPAEFVVSDWTDTFGNFFHAVAMEKTMMLLILSLLIAIAAFNLVSSLVMLVTDKESDIAILRTMGAKPSQMMSVFVIQGSFIGVIGTLLGVVGGVVLSLNTSAIVNFIQTVFHVQLISSDVYFIDFVPSRLMAGDVIQVIIIAVIMSLLATLYPAWRAARMHPAEVLRYE